MLSTLATLALLHWIVLVTPGANVLLVTQLAASGQRRSAYYAGLGVTVVAITWAMLAILGVNALFVALPALRIALQVLGGTYLCYVALRLWRAGGADSEDTRETISALSAFKLGFLTNIMNPKSALFFGSIFATVLPQEPDNALLAAAVALVFVNAFCWHTILAFTFSHRRVQKIYARHWLLLSRVASALVGAFGLRLLVGTVNEIRRD